VTGSRLIFGAVASTLVLGALAVVQAQAASHAVPKSIATGIRFDKSGRGPVQTDAKPSGFGVASYIAGSLGDRPDQIRWVSAPSSEREKLISLSNSHDGTARPHPRRPDARGPHSRRPHARRPHPRRPHPPIDGRSVPRGRRSQKRLVIFRVASNFRSNRVPLPG